MNNLAGKWMVNGVLQELTEDQVIQYATNWLQESSPTYVWKEGLEVLKPTRKLDVELIQDQAARIRDLEAEIERLKIALELKDHDFKTRWSAMLGD